MCVSASIICWHVWIPENTHRHDRHQLLEQQQVEGLPRAQRVRQVLRQRRHIHARPRLLVHRTLVSLLRCSAPAAGACLAAYSYLNRQAFIIAP